MPNVEKDALARALTFPGHSDHFAAWFKDGKKVRHEDVGGIQCLCGWSAPKVNGFYRPWDDWYAHLADVLIASGWRVTPPDGDQGASVLPSTRGSRMSEDDIERHEDGQAASLIAVPWECPGCGKTAQVNLAALGPLGVVRCTCGRHSRPAVDSVEQDVRSALRRHQAEPCSESRPDHHFEWWYCPACGWESEHQSIRDPGGVVMHQVQALAAEGLLRRGPAPDRTEVIAKVLDDHQFNAAGPGADASCYGAGCAWTHPWDRPTHEMWAAHRTHVAEQISLLDERPS